MAINDGDVIRVVARMAQGVNDVINTYHCRYSGPTEDDNDVYGSIRLWMDELYTLFNQWVAGTVDYETISAHNITQDRPIAVDTWPTLVSGGGDPGDLPPQCAPLCLFNTLVGRSQGRKYLPPMDGAVQDSQGILLAGPLASFAAYAAALLVDRVAGNGILNMGNWSPTKVRFATWILGTVTGIMRTQRRRVLGVGT